MCFVAFHHQIPLMVVSYAGSLKMFIYAPIFSFFGANVWSLRLPVLLAGAITVFFFFRLSILLAGPLATVVGASLLATDPTFLLTNTVDWGPVALSQLLLVTGCFFVARFAQLELTHSKKDSMRDLAFGFFLFGLGLWNKALFLWALTGLVAAAVLVFWPEVRRLFAWRRVILAAVAFLFGASPFIMYNVRQPNATLKNNAHFDSVKTAMMKLPPLEASLDGSVLMGYFTTESWDVPNPKAPSSLHGRFAWWIERHLGEHRHSGMLYGLGIALLLVPWWWRRRAAWFSLVFMCVVWLQMAFTSGAGGAAHHCVLMWPFPQLFLGIAFSAIPWPRVALLGGAVLVVMNLLVLDKYIVDFERNGAGPIFTDALSPLSDALPDLEPKQRVWVVDWGILNSIALLHQGRLEVRVGDPPFMTDHPSPDEQKDIDYMLHDRGAIFVGHVAKQELFKGVRDRLEQAVAAAGFRKEITQTISDSNGRPMFEIFRIQ